MPSERPQLIPAKDTETVLRDEATNSSRLVGLLDGYMAEILAGGRPDRERLLAEHPDLAAELEPCLAGIEFIHTVAAPASGQPARLGEFVILREIGRGGMGVVYEAEQTTLKRRVALKVLRLGMAADSAAMDRFRREAETVARLHHTHIVPIFAVGSQEGISYYAMQYIEGCSLDAVLASSRATSTPLEVDKIARWGLQAAEALDHAHQRGVIHRDVKPSNLLLDHEGLIWLTDFGLAKRDDEVTLTLCGTLMGTPRYMSPEQADATKQDVDPRTDIYSLGATMYELAVGLPVFDSSTPHGMILKILRDEPVPPRQIRSDIPRDLDTIIQKCLHKHPDDRYATAQALADDLRAFLDGRPIRARRANLVERAVRFARQHKKGATIAGVAALAATVLIVGSLVGWRQYDVWRQGRLVLSTAGPPLAAQLIDERGEPLGDEFSIGTKTVVPLPGGEYRMQVSASGLFSETFRMHVEQGVTQTRTVQLGEGELWKAHPIPYTPAAWGFSFDGKSSDLVASYGRTLRRFNGVTGEAVWTSNPPKLPSNSVFSIELGTDQAYLVADLNGDGLRDLICGDGNARGFRAISGSDGANLWHRELGKPDADPIPIDDLDGDGMTDLLIWVDDGHASHQVEAISSRTGRGIWTGPPVPFRSYRPSLPPAVVKVGEEMRVEIVDESRWFELDVKTGAVRGEPFALPGEPKRAPQFADLDGDGNTEMLLLTPGRAGDESLLSAYTITTRRLLWATRISGEFVEVLDRTGVRSTWPVLVDLDPKTPGTDVTVPDSNTVPPSFRYRGVRALEGATGRQRWSVPLKRWQNAGTPIEPIVAGPDLDGDGVPELFSATIEEGKPGANTSAFGTSGELPRLYVDALSGRDGRHLWWWDKSLESKDLRLESLGWGKVGTQGTEFLAVGLAKADQLLFSRMLSVPEDSPGATFLIDVHHGVKLRSSPSFRLIGIRDFNGDGMSDLWGVAKGGLRGFQTQPVEAWRALGPFVRGADYDGDGLEDVVSADSRGDTFSPLGSGNKSRTILARSGRDGSMIWEADLLRKQPTDGDAEWTGFHPIPLFGPEGDLDGDGTPDLITTKSSTVTVVQHSGIHIPLDAYSGKTGKRLWSIGIVPSTAEGSGLANAHGAAARDLDGDGKADPVVLHTSLLWDASLSTGQFRYQTRLSRINGTNGQVVWDRVLAEWSGLGILTTEEFRHAFGNLDGDGNLDVIVVVPVGDLGGRQTYEIHALSGRDGASLWTHKVREQSGYPSFAAGDVDGDSLDDVVVADRAPGPFVDGKAMEIVSLHGKTGKPHWSWLGGDQVDANNPHGFQMVLADFEGTGRRSVCFNAGRLGGREIVRLEADGRVGQFRRDRSGWFSGIHAADLDGDGRDELVVHIDGAIRAVTRNLDRELWSWPDAHDIKAVIRSKSSKIAGVVISGDDTAIDGMTGRPSWQAPGARAYLADVDPKRAPHFLQGGLAHDAATVCREAAGIAYPSKPTIARTSGVSAPLRDPRLSRPLPWAIEPFETGAGILTIGCTAGVSLVVFVIPYLILRRAMRQNRRSLKALMALPVVVAVIYAPLRAAISVLPPMPLTNWQLCALYLLTAILGLPILIYMSRIVGASWNRRWGSLSLLALTTLLCTAAIAGGLLAHDLSKMSAIEYYRLAGAPICVVLGAYASGCLLLGWTVLQRSVRLAGKGVQAVRRRSTMVSS